MKNKKVIISILVLLTLVLSGFSIANIVENEKIKEETIVLKAKLNKQKEVKEEVKNNLEEVKNTKLAYETEEKSKGKELDTLKKEKEKLAKELAELKEK